MKQLFFAILFVALLSSAGATPPPPSYYGTQEVTVDDFKNIDKLKMELHEKIHDIVNPYGEHEINCNDWALIWYILWNGGTEPKRARLFCNNIIKHAFVGVNVEGEWFYIDAQTCLPMGHPSLHDYNYNEKDNWDCTDFVMSAYMMLGKGDAIIWNRLRSQQGIDDNGYGTR